MKMFNVKVFGLICFIFVSGQNIFAQSDDGNITWDKGIMHLRSDDGNFKTKFDVRMFIQGGKYYDDTQDVLREGTFLRKGRFAMKVQMWDVWKAEWDMDIADKTLEIKDMWVAYTGLENAFIKIGHYKVPFGLEILTSSRYISFIERSYPSLAFKMGRRMSLGYTRWGEIWNISGTYFGQEFAPGDTKNMKNDETGGGFAFRGAVIPQFGPLLTHIGASYVKYTPDSETDAVEFKTEPENKLGDDEHVDAGVISNVDYVTQMGIEGAVQYNNFCVQSEYMQTDVIRFGEAIDNNDILQPYNDAQFNGGYAYISWLITGEKRPWDKTQGEFGQVIPKSNKIGAWELLYKYSYINLTDITATSYGYTGGIQGGKAVNETVGLTWYANPNVKFMANYIVTKNSEYATGLTSGGYNFRSLLVQALIYF